MNLDNGTVRSYLKALSDNELENLDSLLSLNASISAFLILSPDANILNIKLSSSSPYLPVRVVKFSNEGVCIS